MKINAVLQAYAAPALLSGTPSKAPAKSANEAMPTQRRGDSVEISSEGKRRLAHIQGRIESGYYNSPAIADDISDKLSKVLDDIT